MSAEQIREDDQRVAKNRIKVLMLLAIWFGALAPAHSAGNADAFTPQNNLYRSRTQKRQGAFGRKSDNGASSNPSVGDDNNGSGDDGNIPQYPQTKSVEETQERIERMNEYLRLMNEVSDSDTDIENEKNQCKVHEKVKKVVSRINEDDGLVRAAEKACKNSNVQKDVNHLQDELAKGNMNPGINSKQLFKNVFEHRARNGGRLYVRELEDVVEILAKSGKSKSNQDFVINRLKELYN